MIKKILCMGSINIDLVMYMSKLPTAGETVVTDNFQTFSGGKGGNQAATASLLGGNVKYFTKLGTDNFSKELISKQIEYGVDMSNIIIEPDSTAGIAMIRVDESGQNSISFTPGANSLLTPEDVEKNAHIFDDCDILLITMEIQNETVYKAIEIAKSKDMIVVLDPAPAPENGIPDDIAKLVDYTKPNETEAQILTGIKISDMETSKFALRRLKEKGFKSPIITLSNAGAITYDEEQLYFIEPLKVNSIDSTAAGDVFIGAFTAALSKGESYKECLRFAKTAAAFSTKVKGAQSSIPNLNELTEYLNGQDQI